MNIYIHTFLDIYICAYTYISKLVNIVSDKSQLLVCFIVQLLTRRKREGNLVSKTLPESIQTFSKTHARFVHETVSQTVDDVLDLRVQHLLLYRQDLVTQGVRNLVGN